MQLVLLNSNLESKNCGWKYIPASPMLSAKINLLENGYSAKSQFGARPLPLAPALKPFSFDPLRNIGLFKSNAANMRTSIWGKPAALSKLFQPDLESSWGHANIGPAFILPSLMMRVNPVIWALKQTTEDLQDIFGLLCSSRMDVALWWYKWGGIGMGWWMFICKWADEGSHNKIHASSIAQISKFLVYKYIYIYL